MSRNDRRARSTGAAGRHVVAGYAGAGRDTGDRGGVGPQRVFPGPGTDDVAAHRVGRRIFRDGQRVRMRDRRRVEDVDGQRAALRIAVVVPDDDTDRVDDFAARMILGGSARFVAVADNTGHRVMAGNRQGALGGRDGHRRRAAALECRFAHHRAGNGQRRRRIQPVRRANREVARRRRIFGNTRLACSTTIHVRYGEADDIVHRRDVDRCHGRRFVDGSGIVDGCVLEGCRTVPVVVWLEEHPADHCLPNRDQLSKGGIGIEQPVCRQAPDHITSDDSVRIASLEIYPERAILATGQRDVFGLGRSKGEYRRRLTANPAPANFIQRVAAARTELKCKWVDQFDDAGQLNERMPFFLRAPSIQPSAIILKTESAIGTDERLAYLGKPARVVLQRTVT